MVYAKLEKFPSGRKCNFCHTNQVDEIDLGEIASTSNLYVHYFCLLLSSDIPQKGADKSGILGFMPKDIKTELSRGKKSLCAYCGRSTATIKCSYKKCNSIFHLPCGLKKGSLHQFFGEYRSFCRKHRPPENIPHRIKTNATACVVCLNEFNKSDQVYWPACCKPPDSLIHRKCLQKMALISGLYYMKCPLCNDNATFLKSAQKFGVYIPERDPAWERDGTFNDLLDRRVPCEKGQNCLSSKGPHFNRNRTQWMIHRCQFCGGSGIHLACSNLWQPGSKYEINWACKSCAPTPSNIAASSSSEAEEMSVDPFLPKPESPCLRIQSWQSVCNGVSPPHLNSDIFLNNGHVAERVASGTPPNVQKLRQMNSNHQSECGISITRSVIKIDSAVQTDPFDDDSEEDDIIIVDEPSSSQPPISRLSQHTELPPRSSNCPDSDTIIVSDSDEYLSVYEISSTDSDIDFQDH